MCFVSIFEFETEDTDYMSIKAVYIIKQILNRQNLLQI